MACPFFIPLKILNDGSWPHPPRLPLGAGWTGHCCALGGELAPSDLHLREFCNLGYATGCPHLPLERDWDAIRFSIARVSDEQITICFECELGHAPVEHGELIFDLRREAWDLRRETWLTAQGKAHEDARVRRLAACYLETYRARRESVAV